MADMWRTRQPPIPLDFIPIVQGSFVLRSEARGPTASASQPAESQNGTTSGGLKDQRNLSLLDNLELFVSRYVPGWTASLLNSPPDLVLC